MVVADIEKAFDFLGHSVLLASLKKHGYRTELIHSATREASCIYQFITNYQPLDQLR